VATGQEVYPQAIPVTQAPVASRAPKPRPPLLRALGPSEPPETVQVEGTLYQRSDIFKHDSWAATALYDGPDKKIVCKFNRVQPVLGVPMNWLGHLLAQREARMLRRLADLPNVPRWSGIVRAEGRRMDHAVAHDYIAGHPLGEHEVVGKRFFATLRDLLAEMHRRGLAYVDLHKRENILVGDDGEPYLIDFQISVGLPSWWPGNSIVSRTILHFFQQSDLYHLAKNEARTQGDPTVDVPVPWWIRLHRIVAQPFRSLRRGLLVQLGVRTQGGSASSEQFAEDAFRNPPPAKAA
jgi:hypothetical protein